jgi:hypothetical protein
MDVRRCCCWCCAEGIEASSAVELGAQRHGSEPRIF